MKNIQKGIHIKENAQRKYCIWIATIDLDCHHLLYQDFTLILLQSLYLVFACQYGNGDRVVGNGATSDFTASQPVEGFFHTLTLTFMLSSSS